MSASHQGQAFLTSAAFLAPASARSFVLVNGAPGVEEWTRRYREALAEEAGILNSESSLHQLQSHIRAVESDVAKRRQNELMIFSECMFLAGHIPVQPGCVPPATGQPVFDPSRAPNPAPVPPPDFRTANLALRLAEAAKATLSGELLASQMRIREAETHLESLRTENRRVERACWLCHAHFSSLVACLAVGVPGQRAANRAGEGCEKVHVEAVQTEGVVDKESVVDEESVVDKEPAVVDKESAVVDKEPMVDKEPVVGNDGAEGQGRDSAEEDD